MRYALVSRASHSLTSLTQPWLQTPVPNSSTGTHNFAGTPPLLVASSCASSCASQYANYTSTSTEDACVKVISCILDKTPEAVKVNMASAGLLLGLLPALLGFLGSSTIETSCLAARRPVLSLLLSLGSPAVNPIRIYDYRDIVRKIINLNETVSLPTIPRGLLLRKATFDFDIRIDSRRHREHDVCKPGFGAKNGVE